MTTPVTLPSRTWKIAAVPRGGWPPPQGLWLKRALFALAGLMIALPDPRDRAAPEPAPRPARDHPPARGRAVAAVLAARVRARHLERRGLGRRSRDRPADLGRARQGALRHLGGRRRLRRQGMGAGAFIPRTAARRRRRRGRGRRGRPVRGGVPHRAAGRRDPPHARHRRGLRRRRRLAASGRAGLGRDARRRAQRGAEPAPARGGGRDGREVALPRGDEPRDPHAARRRARAARADARRAAAGAAARARRDRARLGAEPARDPERHPRLLEARGAADPAQRGERRRPRRWCAT